MKLSRKLKLSLIIAVPVLAAFITAGILYFNRKPAETLFTLNRNEIVSVTLEYTARVPNEGADENMPQYISRRATKELSEDEITEYVNRFNSYEVYKVDTKKYKVSVLYAFIGAEPTVQTVTFKDGKTLEISQPAEGYFNLGGEISNKGEYIYFTSVGVVKNMAEYEKHRRI